MFSQFCSAIADTLSQTELAINTHVVVSDTHAMISDTHAMVSDLHRNALTIQGGTADQHCSVSGTPIHLWQSAHCFIDSTQVSNIEHYMAHSLMCPSRILPGEFPPPPPACFRRDELIEKVISLAENFTPIALIGAGGINKTSIALALLHDGHIES